jgi:hypothetical protein
MNSASAPSAQFLGKLLACLVAPSGDDDVRSPLGEGDRGGAADASERTGDQNDRLVHSRFL